MDTNLQEPTITLPKFVIVPSTLSTVGSVMVVFVLFLLYMVYIGYIASYNLKFYPNMYMFWNFITSGNNLQYQSEFESYVRSVMNNTHAENTPVMYHTNSMEDVAESFTNPEATKIEDAYGMEGYQDMLNSWKIKLLMLWNQLILKSFVRGKTIHVTRL
uniref:Uncharacterized protein n=1 Tax=viral metagenome TaxID=1070528 RepID=A0A6C0ID08_9ZZZZ